MVGIKEQVVLHEYMIYYGDDYHASVRAACADHARLLLSIPLLTIKAVKKWEEGKGWVLICPMEDS